MDTYAEPTAEERATQPAARAAYYAIWLKLAFEGHWQEVGIESIMQLSTIMKMCPGCGIGTGNMFACCGGPVCSTCEDEMECPECEA